ncbi:MAG: hypothetical protein HKM98_10000 [Gammaproteobacteria bacterium]|nr:hypothetical protein [Gammaproteobacteria bacterium]
MLLPELNFYSVAHILVEILFVGGVGLTLFRFRRQLSLGPLYVFVGTLQFLSMLVTSTVFVSVSPQLAISPGSSVLFSASIFTILLVYLRTDVPTSRGLIFGVVIANLTLVILLWFTGYQLTVLGAANRLDVPAEIFLVSPFLFISGTLLLLVDFLLVVVVYDYFRLHLIWMPRLGRLLITIVGVLCFDALAFSSIVALGEPTFFPILSGQLVGKSFAGFIYGLLLYFYLTLIEPAPVRAHAQDISDVFSIFTHRERYRQVRAQLEVAEAANVAKSRFLANMSHELRTPLNAIIGFASIVRERNQNEEEKNYLDRVLDNGKHLLQLINGLLDLSKIESGRNELELVDVDLHLLLEETTALLQSQARQKELQLVVESPGAPAFLITDRMRMKQILINLIGNSLKFTETGSVVARLVADPADGRPLRIDILDTGIGIPADELESIFQPFYQEQARSRHAGGTGLGLAISKALCDQMGHQLNVSSETGRGSQFSIVFGAAD